MRFAPANVDGYRYVAAACLRGTCVLEIAARPEGACPQVLQRAARLGQEVRQGQMCAKVASVRTDQDASIPAQHGDGAQVGSVAQKMGQAGGSLVALCGMDEAAFNGAEALGEMVLEGSGTQCGSFELAIDVLGAQAPDDVRGCCERPQAGQQDNRDEKGAPAPAGVR